MDPNNSQPYQPQPPTPTGYPPAQQPQQPQAPPQPLPAQPPVAPSYPTNQTPYQGPPQGAWQQPVGNGQFPDQSDYYSKGQKPAITLGVLSIVFCWIPIIAWILGGIAVSKGNLNPKLRTLGIIGIGLGSLFAIFNLMIFLS